MKPKVAEPVAPAAPPKVARAPKEGDEVTFTPDAELLAFFVNDCITEPLPAGCKTFAGKVTFVVPDTTTAQIKLVMPVRCRHDPMVVAKLGTGPGTYAFKS